MREPAVVRIFERLSAERHRAKQNNDQRRAEACKVVTNSLYARYHE